MLGAQNTPSRSQPRSVSTDPQDSAPIDFSRVHEVAEGDASFERQVLTVFMADATARLAQIGDAVAQADFGVVVLECHNLKGAAGNVGALPLRAAAETCETAARNADAAAARDALVAMRAAYTEARAAIQAYLA